MKRAAALCLALVMVLSLAGCRNLTAGNDRTGGDVMDPARGDVTSSGNGADGTGVIGTGPNDPHDGDLMGSGSTSHSSGADRDARPDTDRTSGTQTTSGTQSQTASGKRAGGMG